MKKILSNKKGFTLLEVILAILILAIFTISFITGISHSYITLYRSKSMTENTYDLQELIEDKIALVTVDDLILGEQGVDKVSVYGEEVIYKKIEVNLEDSNRNLFAYISYPRIGERPTPEIRDLVVKAYNEGNNETFPWYENGTRLEASYNDDDSNIFMMNYSWFESKTVSGIPLFNPVFNTDYIRIKYRDGVHRGTMPTLLKSLTFYELKPNRYYHYSILPYSDQGRLGRLQTNQERILVIEKTGNQYWNNLIEDVYLKNFTNVKINLNPLILTMNNINEVTLNVESDDSDKYNKALFYYPINISSYKNKTSSFRAKVNMEFDEKAVNQEVEDNKETGVGIFLGDYNNGNENGILFLIDQNERNITVKSIENGALTNTLREFIIDENFDFNRRYNWNFNISRNSLGQGTVAVSYINQDNQLIPFSTEDTQILDLNFITNDIGLKTWSDYTIKDEYNEEHQYLYNLTAHFYDINFVAPNN